MKKKRILSIIILLAFILKVTASFSYFQEGISSQVDFYSKFKTTLHSKSTSNSHRSSQINIDDLKFEKEEEDGDETNEKNLALFYYFIFEIRRSVNNSPVFCHHISIDSNTQPIFILLGQLII